MSYLHINNLYKDQRILAFKRCYALEKIHGTSAHISWNEGQLGFFSGESLHVFEKLFDSAALSEAFSRLGHAKVMVYGEAYGGKCQGMKLTYGDSLQFIVFDVKIDNSWLSVPGMQQVADVLGLETVPWVETSTDVVELDRLRDLSSEVAVRRGCGNRPREGIVIRPPFEVTTNNGERVIAKHKADAFAERSKPPKVQDPTKLAVIAEAEAIAAEWVTCMRLTHVLDKIDGEPAIERMPEIIKAMIEDVYREAKGEIVESKEAKTAIGKRTAIMFKSRLKASLHE